MNVLVHCLVDSKGCLISSKDGKYGLYTLTRYTLTQNVGSQCSRKSSIIELFQDALMIIIQPNVSSDLQDAGFGKKGGNSG